MGDMRTHNASAGKTYISCNQKKKEDNLKHVITFDRQTTNSASGHRARGTTVLTRAGFLRNSVFTIMLNTKSVETCSQLGF